MLLEDITEYLEAQAVGTRGTDLFYGTLPTDPDAVVVVFEYSGAPNEPDLGKGVVRLEFPNIQIVVRGAKDDYKTPRLRAQSIIALMEKVANQTISAAGPVYKSIDHKSGPFAYKVDENLRYEFSINFRAMRNFSAT